MNTDLPKIWSCPAKHWRSNRKYNLRSRLQTSIKLTEIEKPSRVVKHYENLKIKHGSHTRRICLKVAQCTNAAFEQFQTHKKLLEKRQNPATTKQTWKAWTHLATTRFQNNSRTWTTDDRWKHKQTIGFRPNTSIILANRRQIRKSTLDRVCRTCVNQTSTHHYAWRNRICCKTRNINPTADHVPKQYGIGHQTSYNRANIHSSKNPKLRQISINIRDLNTITNQKEIQMSTSIRKPDKNWRANRQSQD